MSSRAKVVRVKSWDELPDTLSPGVYYVDGVKVEVRGRVPKEEVRMAVSGVKQFADDYYS